MWLFCTPLNLSRVSKGCKSTKEMWLPQIPVSGSWRAKCPKITWIMLPLATGSRDLGVREMLFICIFMCPTIGAWKNYTYCFQLSLSRLVGGGNRAWLLHTNTSGACKNMKRSVFSDTTGASGATPISNGTAPGEGTQKDPFCNACCQALSKGLKEHERDTSAAPSCLKSVFLKDKGNQAGITWVSYPGPKQAACPV